MTNLKCLWHSCQLNSIDQKNKFCSPQCRNKYYVSRRRKAIKLKAIEYKGSKCQKCGYNRCVDAFDFHHLDPNEKEFSPSRYGHCRSWERVKKELDKCILLCANCHRETHSKDFAAPTGGIEPPSMEVNSFPHSP